MGVVESAERAAEDLLASHWPGGSTDPVLPVDPVRIARSLGIEVFVAPMDPQASGALVSQRERDPVIYLSADDAPTRQGFSCAHELGHYAHYVAQGRTDFDRVEWRDARSSSGTDPVERFANGVGAALMMPAQAVQAVSHLDVYDMAKRFGVSALAMGYRLKNLEIDTSTTVASR